MRAAISSFSESIAKLTSGSAGSRGFESLHWELQHFENVYNFPHISDEHRSRDLYRIARTAMDLDSYLDELDKEVRLTTDFFNRQATQDLSRRSLQVGAFALFFALLATVFGFLGSNVLDSESTCALQRTVGDGRTSFCEKAFRERILAAVATEIDETDAGKVSRANYETLCALDLSRALGSIKVSRAKLQQTIHQECEQTSSAGTSFSAWFAWYPNANKWVEWSYNLIVVTLTTGLALLAVVLGKLFWISVAGYPVRKKLRRIWAWIR
jgi:hypothetical protein